MEGIGASPFCTNNKFSLFLDSLSLSPVSEYVNSDTGSSVRLPQCVFTFPNIQVLRLSANGLSGSLPHAYSRSLRTIVLSYNRLSKTIPFELQQLNLRVLDLSFNKLSGVINTWRRQEPNSTMILQVNRLSGDLPNWLFTFPPSYLNVLSGNMFSCFPWFSRNTMPTTDVGFSEYTCGSILLNVALTISLGACIIFIVFWVIVVKFLFKRFESKNHKENSEEVREEGETSTRDSSSSSIADHFSNGLNKVADFVDQVSFAYQFLLEYYNISTLKIPHFCHRLRFVNQIFMLQRGMVIRMAIGK